MRAVATLGIILFFIFKTAVAQQIPQYTQYVFNSFLINPAVAGIENYTDLKFGYRKQWAGINGAPETGFISVNMPLGENYLYGNANSFSGGGNNPMSRSYVQEYRAAEPHHGIGIYALTDKAGPARQSNVSAAYAYHIGLSSDFNLALGVNAGLSKFSLDHTVLTTENAEPLLGGNIGTQYKPLIGAGVWLYGPSFFAGISGQQLNSQQLSYTTAELYSNAKLVNHFFATAGYKVYLDDDFAVVPSVMLKYSSPAPLAYDLNAKLAYQDKFWLGAGYRHKDALSAMAGFYLSSLLTVSYSYDASTSALQSVSNGSHEIIIGILLNNRYQVKCPQRQF
jgi:type IX secretion system PorP/SprF family membrane protein